MPTNLILGQKARRLQLVALEYESLRSRRLTRPLLHATSYTFTYEHPTTVHLLKALSRHLPVS